MSKMLEEVRDQPAALSATLAAGVAGLEKLRGHLQKRRPRFILLVARGTSDNAAQFGRYLIEITTRIPVSLAAPSILTLYRRPVDLRDVLVIGISQSGESTDTNAVLEDARKQGATTVGITNNPASAMASAVEFPLPIQAGAEISVAATKTYTCQLLALYLLAHALDGGIELEALRKIPDWVCGVLALEEDIEALVERYFFMTRDGHRRPRAELRQRARIRLEADGDLLRGGRAIFGRRSDARSHRAGGAGLSRFCLRACRSHLAVHVLGAGSLEELKAETLVITDRRNIGSARQGRAPHRDSRSARLERVARRSVHAHPLYRPGAAIRRTPGRAQGSESRSAAHAAQDHSDDVAHGPDAPSTGSGSRSTSQPTQPWAFTIARARAKASTSFFFPGATFPGG